MRDTFPNILKHYIDTGIIRYVVIDLPLPSHPLARAAAEASRCANIQGKYWEMHRQMMTMQSALSDLSSLALSVGLNVSQFDECLKQRKNASDIDKNISLAVKLGLSGVPGFVFADNNPNTPGKVRGLSYIRGAMPYESFKQQIDQTIASLSLSSRSAH